MLIAVVIAPVKRGDRSRRVLSTVFINLPRKVLSMSTPTVLPLSRRIVRSGGRFATRMFGRFR